MTTRILAKTDLGRFLDTLRHGPDGSRRVFAPGKDPKTPGKTIWRAVADAASLDFGYANTDMSPKEFVFPQSECLMRFASRGDTPMVLAEEPLDGPPAVLFGVRPCDAKALAVLDAIFRQDDRANDIYWQRRREATAIVSLACNHPCPTCFCTAVGCGPHHATGSDVLLTDLGDRLLVRPATPRGEALTCGLPEATQADMDAAAARRDAAEAALATPEATLDMRAIEARTVLELYDMPHWDRVAATCLNCGTCTFACPTCHCFDIQDESTAMQGRDGRRMRNWDSCMSPLFTLHASRHNPRGAKVARVRQRFMHKFKYIPMKRNGAIGCVGCGRCVRLCPVNIDVRDVVKAMNAAFKDESPC
ncbi:MAG: 4Fe-4S dicluster domain-containing protein [Desulfovibrionaceae bacterium]